MSKTILADVSGFTPIIDTMAMEHGLIYAAVFGRMWRFCQMEDGVCKASLDKIAQGLHVDKATVMRYADRLVADGYLTDLTPDLHNAPHVYADTGKAAIRVGIGATVAGCNADSESVAQRNATVAGCNATVAQSQLKIVSKKDSKNGNNREGISHPDFERACACLQETRPADYAAAAPVLMEYDEKPYRMRVKVTSWPPNWSETFGQALREANPRRHYRIEFETPGTGHPVPAKIGIKAAEVHPIEALPDDSVTDKCLMIWNQIISEIECDVSRETFNAYFKPTRLISVNGAWTVEVPSLGWWNARMPSTIKRIYKGLTGQVADFIFVELAK